MKYRQELDGLRAIAIIPVLLFHTGTPYLTGGYLGVDVFFVISGFLITRIILEEISNNKFSITDFYERRARRILPALVPVILVTATLIPLFDQSPKVLADFGESVVSVTFFLSNVYFFQTSGYFGGTSELSPLLHTWSLAVEEQFYLFFPLLAIFCLSFVGRRYFIYILCFIFIVSLGIAEWGWRNQPIGNFYLLPTRAWELLIGSFGAVFIVSNKFEAYKPKYKSFLSGLGLLLILTSYFIFTPETPHPSVITLIPVVGSLLVILFSDHDNFCGKLLKFRLLVHIGLISYSLYLWHQPVLALAKLSSSIHLSTSIQIILLFLIYSVSLLSYKYIETPFRNKKSFCKAEIYKYSAISIGVTLCVGIIFMFNMQIQQRIFPEEMKTYNMLLTAHNSHEHQVMYEEECKFWSSSLDKEFKAKFHGCSEKYGKALVVLGGSHGMDLYNAIAMNTNHKFVISLSSGFCRAHDFIGAMRTFKQCQYEDFKTFSSVNSDHILSVIYTQTPDRLFTENMNSATESSLSIKHVDQVVNYLSTLKDDLHLDVLMVGMLPPMMEPPIKLDHTQDIEAQLSSNMSTNTTILTKYVDKVFSDKLARHNIPYISKFDGFELDFPKDFVSNGHITYSDNRHLSLEGEKIFGNRLMKFLNFGNSSE